MKKRVIGFLIIFVMFIQGCNEPASEDFGDVKEESEVQDQPAVDANQGGRAVPGEEIAEKNESPGERDAPQWVYGGPAIEGNYADSDFVDLGNGKYRMYYAI